MSQGPFPKRAESAKTTLIPLTAQQKQPGLSFKMAELNQSQLAGNKANAARLILYLRKIDSGVL